MKIVIKTDAGHVFTESTFQARSFRSYMTLSDVDMVDEDGNGCSLWDLIKGGFKFAKECGSS